MRSPKLAVGIIAAAIIAAILLGGRINPQPDTTQETTPTAATPRQTTHSTNPAPPPEHPHHPEEGSNHEPPHSPVATPSHDGGEDPRWEPDTQTQQAAIATAAAFVTGWLQTDTTRGELLEPVTAPALLETLTTPGIKTWSTTPNGPPDIVELAATNALIRQTFTDGRSIDILVTAEPAAAHGWLIIDVQPTQP